MIYNDIRSNKKKYKEYVRAQVGQLNEGVSKGTPSFFILFISFCSSKRNEPKKKGAGNDNFNPFWQNTLGITLPKRVEVRAISGLPAHDPFEIPVNNYSKVLKRGCLKSYFSITTKY
jgi:hypothetical protein